ncbi:unnamed protein product [Parnassius mnemosyne]|uniref:Uncharacterized protein n=1 Tax=Parnassius mnemosyne TaxID=213953 RepID=A0AAV1L819_9NEOP
MENQRYRKGDYRKCYPDSAPGETTIRKGFAKFRTGHMSTDYDERSGRPKEAVTDENIKKIHKMILKDHLKRMLAGKKFKADEKVIAETEAYFEAKHKSHYKNGIEKLKDRYNQCIALDGHYVE